EHDANSRQHPFLAGASALRKHLIRLAAPALRVMPARERRRLPHRARLGLVAAALAAVAITLAGCGSSSSPVDKGGFTDKARTQAQAALDTFKGTAIPGTIVQLTATIGLPSVCRVHYSGKNTDTLYLVMAWRPQKRTSNAFTWFTAQIGPSGPIPT